MVPGIPMSELIRLVFAYVRIPEESVRRKALEDVESLAPPEGPHTQ